MTATLTRIGDFCVRRRWLVLAIWLVVLGLTVAGAVRFGEPTNAELTVSNLPSTQALDTVQRDFGGSDADGGKVVFSGTDKTAVAALGRALAAVPGVGSVGTPVLSPGGQIGYFPVALGTASVDGIGAAMDQGRAAGLHVEASSDLAPPADSSNSPAVGLVIALVVLLITFGSLVAAGLSLGTALIGLGVAIAGIHAVTALVPLNSVAPTLAILLGLAVGIDYALFLIDRHRRQLRAGDIDVRTSVARAVGTAGSAVFFAALTVIIALAGLAVVRIGFLTQMGLAAAGAVAVAMLVALTLTPALLGFAGRRVLGRRQRQHRPAYASRWVNGVVRHRLLAVAFAVVVLGVLAAPVAGMRLDLPNDGSDPASATDRRAYDLIASGFGPGANGPLLVLARSSAPVSRPLQALPGVAQVIPGPVRGDEALYTVVPVGGPSDESTGKLVKALRRSDVVPGVTLLVTGQTAVALDISDHLLHALPLYLALVAGFAFVLLLIVFRSVLIPLKATLSFLLSLGAALGCTVAAYQWGWLGQAGPLLSFLPTIVIGVLFGLSMDYEMFLVSGMHEEQRRGVPAETALVSGFSRGAKVVTAAALIMFGVFGGGALGGDPITGPIAFALAAGVLVDAFIVRLLLVPAVMSLFGRAAWWLPGRRPGPAPDPSASPAPELAGSTPAP